MKTKKEYISISFVLWISFLIIITSATIYAGVPQYLSFQGKLLEDGEPINGYRSMTFSIWDNPNGGDSASALWYESQNVQISEGVYNVELGTGTALPGDLSGYEDLYLQVAVLHPTKGTQRLRPLMSFNSNVFALKAAEADHATSAGTASNAANADYAASADTASNATDADYATNAGYATSAGSASSATNANHATSAGDADTLDGQHASAFYTQTQVDSIVASLENRISQLESLLADVTRNGNDLTFSGVNVHIVNGTGATDGAVNGLGNLIVGYNKFRESGNNRTGSHTIVVGDYQNYSSYGGLIAGMMNDVSGPYASVSGGYGNAASNDSSSVSGGYGNTASGWYSSVSGGSDNKANGWYSSVSGGCENTTSNDSSSVSGGYRNAAMGINSSVSGGYENMTISTNSSVSGGSDNTATGINSSVSGGYENMTMGTNSSVSGGRNNKASGNYSFVGGGGHESSEYGNEAYSDYSAVLGGVANVAGDGADHGNAQQATVSGGNSNRASGPVSSVHGGRDNTASGWYSTVSGGASRSVSGTDDWRAGGYFQDN